MSEMIRKNEPFMVQQDYQDLIRQVGCDLEAGRMQVVSAVNSAMVRTYWMRSDSILLNMNRRVMRKRNTDPVC